ncbi:tyrosine-type recombinase/integrase [Cloacibacillus porcorum]|uniref:tyrosine-type recombinase/integrase n=1 Tax=Cloacibacillus porcorum TaxID=1197717 RepID=UPI003C6C3E01
MGENRTNTFLKIGKYQKIKRLSEVGCEPKRGGLSDEEIKKFLAATDDWQKQEEKYYMKPIVLFLLNTGLRPASVCGLIWSDVDFQSRTLYIRAANIKTRKSMHIALSNVALENLRTLPRGKDDENIFTTFQSKHICKKIKEKRLSPILCKPRRSRRIYLRQTEGYI